mgnify:CR=1 FL=1
MAPKRNGKAKTAARTAVAKIPQPHGGQLYAGGVPGNRGGGAKPSKFLAGLKVALEAGKAPEVIQGIISGDILEHLGTDKEGRAIVGETRNADRLKAIEFAAGYVEGKPTQPVDLHQAEPFIFRVVAE